MCMYIHVYLYIYVCIYINNKQTIKRVKKQYNNPANNKEQQRKTTTASSFLCFAGSGSVGLGRFFLALMLPVPAIVEWQNC